MGIFITFEGGEGSGKTTQIDLVKKKLSQMGYDVYSTREPGGTEISNKIRTILLDSENKALVPLAELLLYEASRAQHVEEFIKPILKKERAIVLCDRFYDASTAYQAGARNLETELVQKLNKIASQGLIPDLTIYIDIEPEVGVKRALKRIEHDSSKEDRFENENLTFHKRVRDAYLKISENDCKRVKLVNGTGTINDVNMKIMEHLKCFLQK